MYRNQVFDCLRTMNRNSKDWPDNHGTLVRVSNNRPQHTRIQCSLALT